tara:strand:+ start:3452 stop:4237 length:786 start_codon:yes stop_codon:yes gene_type:complete
MGQVYSVAIQQIFTSSTCANLRNALATDDWLSKYRNAESYPAPDAPLLPTTISIPEQPPVLTVGNQRTADDADNAIRVYEYLGSLTRTQAADTRLWVTLTHTTFWHYCQKRWPVGEQSTNFVREHWFERPGGGLGALRRNAISRLWWAAHLTVAPWESDGELTSFQNSDRAVYTRILLSQQQNFQDVLERSYGSNLRLRICLLEALRVYQPQVTNRDGLIRDVSRKLNLVIKHRQLDAMDVGELKEITDELVRQSAERLNG